MVGWWWAPLEAFSGVSQSIHTRQHLALQELKASTATSADMADLVLSPKVLGGSGGIPTADDSHAPLLSGLNHSVHDGLGALGERLELKHPSGPVPHDGLGTQHRRLVEVVAERPTIQAHPAVRDARSLVPGLGLRVRSKLVSQNEVNGEVELHPLRLGLLDNLRHNLRTLLVVQGAPNGHPVHHLEEGVCHTTTDDHFIHLVDHVVDELDFVAHLGPSKDRQERALRVVQRLSKVVELLLHAESSNLLGQIYTHHGGVGPVRSAEGIVHVDIAQLGKTGTEGRDRVFVCLHLGTGGIHSFALFFNVEPQVLQKNHAPCSRVRACCLGLRTHAVGQECDGHTELGLEDRGDHLQRELVVGQAIRPAQVGHQNHRLGTTLQSRLDSGQSSIDALGVGHLAGLLVLRDVEINPHQDPLASDLDIGDTSLDHREAKV
mmetsp:Transcript_95844/g.165206  ORF Transcript_95844/g.165206 Transcript_95844/m.165206 type:complete len:434 (+) Transcript_95844:814-2115(+)